MDGFKDTLMGLFGIAIIGTLIAAYISFDSLMYICDEANSTNEFTTGESVYLYKDGGISYHSRRNDGIEYSSDYKHKKIEGSKYISYVRELEYATWSIKLNKEDLSYYYRLGDRSGQCEKVGFFERLSIEDGFKNFNQ